MEKYEKPIMEVVEIADDVIASSCDIVLINPETSGTGEYCMGIDG